MDDEDLDLFIDQCMSSATIRLTSRVINQHVDRPMVTVKYDDWCAGSGPRAFPWPFTKTGRIAKAYERTASTILWRKTH